MNDKLLADLIDILRLYREKVITSKTSLSITIPKDNAKLRIVSVYCQDDPINQTEITTDEIEEFDNKTIFEIIKVFKDNKKYKEDKVTLEDENIYDYQCILENDEQMEIKGVDLTLVNKIKTQLTGTPYMDEKPVVKIHSRGYSRILLLTLLLFLSLDILLLILYIIKNR